MSDRLDFEPGSEPERYELQPEPPYRLPLDRRDFFKAVGGGIAVLLVLDGSAASESGPTAQRGGQGQAAELGAWLHIDEEGRVTAYTGKVEVGQNVKTMLTQAVAEELRLPPEAVRVVTADTDRCPFDQGTFGSRSTPAMVPQLRRAAAAARELLLDLAAERWQAERGALTLRDGRVVNPAGGATLAYGELTQGQRLTRAVPNNVPLTPTAEWQVLGKTLGKVEGRDFVTGRHRFTSDLRLPGLGIAKVLRPPTLVARLISADTSAAEALEGVSVVRDGDFIGVVAENDLLAERAIAAIRAEWRPGQQISSQELFEHLKRGGDALAQRGGAQRSGSVEAGLAEADVRLEQSYTIAYIAHAPLEPRAAVAQWEEGRMTVWTGTQRPWGVRSEVARALSLPEDRVRVIVPDTGSGYGGKHTGDAAVEAARLARAAERPVKLVWTREEEFNWAYFRPAGVIDVRAGARRDGTLTAWEFHNYNSGASSIRTLYQVPNLHTQFHSVQSPQRQGSYRALAATANHFAREMAMEELAHALELEPLEFRLKNLRDERLRAVFEAAAERFGWGREPAANHGFGIGGGFEKGGYVATCAEVYVDPATRRPRVTRVVCAFECGAVINPAHLQSQVEGCVLQGLGGALFEEIEFSGGRILNPRFSRYRVPRFSDMPEIEVVLVDRPDLPSAGGGETPIVGIAPAIGGAIFRATGQWVRSLPLAPRGVPAG